MTRPSREAAIYIAAAAMTFIVLGGFGLARLLDPAATPDRRMTYIKIACGLAIIIGVAIWGRAWFAPGERLRALAGGAVGLVAGAIGLVAVIWIILLLIRQ